MAEDAWFSLAKAKRKSVRKFWLYSSFQADGMCKFCGSMITSPNSSIRKKHLLNPNACSGYLLSSEAQNSADAEVVAAVRALKLEGQEESERMAVTHATNQLNVLLRKCADLEEANYLLRQRLQTYPTGLALANEHLRTLLSRRLTFSAQASKAWSVQLNNMVHISSIPPPSQWTPEWHHYFGNMGMSRYLYIMKTFFEVARPLYIQAGEHGVDSVTSGRDLLMLVEKSMYIHLYTMRGGNHAMARSAVLRNVETGEYGHLSEKWWRGVLRNVQKSVDPDDLPTLRAGMEVYRSRMAVLHEEKATLARRLAELRAVEEEKRARLLFVPMSQLLQPGGSKSSQHMSSVAVLSPPRGSCTSEPVRSALAMDEDEEVTTDEDDDDDDDKEGGGDSIVYSNKKREHSMHQAVPAGLAMAMSVPGKSASLDDGKEQGVFFLTSSIPAETGEEVQLPRAFSLAQGQDLGDLLDEIQCLPGPSFRAQQPGSTLSREPQYNTTLNDSQLAFRAPGTQMALTLNPPSAFCNDAFPSEKLESGSRRFPMTSGGGLTEDRLSFVGHQIRISSAGQQPPQPGHTSGHTSAPQFQSASSHQHCSQRAVLDRSISALPDLIGLTPREEPDIKHRQLSAFPSSLVGVEEDCHHDWLGGYVGSGRSSGWMLPAYGSSTAAAAGRKGGPTGAPTIGLMKAASAPVPLLSRHPDIPERNNMKDDAAVSVAAAAGCSHMRGVQERQVHSLNPGTPHWQGRLNESSERGADGSWAPAGTALVADVSDNMLLGVPDRVIEVGAAAAAAAVWPSISESPAATSAEVRKTAHEPFSFDMDTLAIEMDAVLTKIQGNLFREALERSMMHKLFAQALGPMGVAGLLINSHPYVIDGIQVMERLLDQNDT
ncbi:hypothetical protein CEUSTIGMA_g8079.t1 [Chlamydomonas eustigma]|uniref:Uncharacterized protein n=1 Tax=Chlamydomonas eustigma TaxID=1157962 RepID=A0A250XC34_9CHLO|nr:hypothetical protein CEUSTIGMA_g8079.t1 [Chlamydomonas eustigma]|eukprot:GAX80644.1 hypothetical protein CEUSTIGMA_g8079.t1 [Chlamydomonas eustigma]